jgi:hypothetical protein
MKTRSGIYSRWCIVFAVVALVLPHHGCHGRHHIVFLVKRSNHSRSCCYRHGRGLTCLGCCCPHAPPSRVSWSPPHTLTWSWLVFVVVFLVNRSTPSYLSCYHHGHGVTCLGCCFPMLPHHGCRGRHHIF